MGNKQEGRELFLWGDERFWGRGASIGVKGGVDTVSGREKKESVSKDGNGGRISGKRGEKREVFALHVHRDGV